MMSTARHLATEPAAAPAPASADTTSEDMTAATGEGSGFPVIKAALFVVGCLLLVLAAANLSHLEQWSQRWGQIPVFLGFFLVMSIAGRWFWTGADAILAKTIGNR
jgi:hypothetical protein